MPIIIVVIPSFYASSHWNSWFSAMLCLRGRNRYPLQIFLREMLIEKQPMDMMTGARAEHALCRLTLRCAVMSIFILPLMAVFLLVQKYFVQGAIRG